jgi:hypothetical protein
VRTAWLVAAFWLILIPATSGQRLYWGAIGGTGLTADFPAYDVGGPADVYGNPAYHFQHLRGPRSLILGGLLEVRLTSSFSIEADVLHRPLQTTLIYAEFPANGPSSTTTENYLSANTWEFPLMLKWNLPSVRAWGWVQPFLEGGPAFRTEENAAAVQPSQFGVTIGAGAAFHLGKVRVAPTIRYTRWQKETGFPPYPTRADQIEFLTSAAWGTASDPLRLKGHRMGLGILAGLPLIHEFHEPYGPLAERTAYLAGVSAQLELRHGLALEVDGIYKPLRAGASQLDKFSVLTWQFPVLAKYHVPKLGRAPFLEAGPSFRLAGNLNGYNPSHYGVTAGGGVETRTGGARLSTVLRYTRWAKDAHPYWLPSGAQYDYERTSANAVELVFGVAF